MGRRDVDHLADSVSRVVHCCHPSPRDCRPHARFCARPPSIFRRVTCRVLSPCIEVGISALWQILLPRRFEGDACGLKRCRGAAPVVARIAARIEAAMPFPLIGRGRGARSLDDHPDAYAGIMDVPGLRPIVDALAGKGGHVKSQMLRFTI